MENNIDHSDPAKQDPSEKARQIQQDIKSLEKELKEIQCSCTHKEYKIANCPSESSTFSLRRVCLKCQKEIGYPSQQEIDDWAKS